MLKIFKGEKNTKSWEEHVKGDQRFLEGLHIKISVLHCGHSQHLCKQRQTLPGKVLQQGDLWQENKKRDVTGLEGDSRQSTREPLLWTWSEANTDETAQKKSHGSATSAEGRCKSSQGCGEGLAQLAMAAPPTTPECRCNPSLNTIPWLQEWTQSQGAPEMCPRRLLMYNLPLPDAGSDLRTASGSQFAFHAVCWILFLLTASAMLPLKVVSACNSNYGIFNFCVLQFCWILFKNIFHTVLFFSLDWEIWPINHISRTSNHLMSFRL